MPMSMQNYLFTIEFATTALYLDSSDSITAGVCHWKFLSEPYRTLTGLHLNYKLDFSKATAPIVYREGSVYKDIVIFAMWFPFPDVGHCQI